MTASTVEHVPYWPGDAVTPFAPQVTQDDVRDADEESIRALSIREPLRPDPGARARLAVLLYQITGWDLFGDAAEQASYAEDAGTYEAEDAERRRIARRRPPHWNGED
jgi:hypothetical protein